MTFVESTKSKSGMVTSNAPHPAIDIFPDEVVKMNFLYTGLVRYLFSIIDGNGW